MPLDSENFTEKPAHKSYAGMAHFAGTGPAGTVCFQCAFFEPSPQKLTGTCKKYREIMRKKGDVFPRHAWSCRYFEPRKRSW